MMYEGVSWFSLKWFMPSAFVDFSWENPMLLYFIPFIPLIFVLKWLYQLKYLRRLPVALPKSELKWRPITLLRFLPVILISCAIALIITALARPQKVNEKTEQWTEGIDIALVIDISATMKFEDFKPNRLEAAKRVANEFIDGRFQDRIGVVIFSGASFPLAPLTSDYDLLHQLIDSEIKFDKIDKTGTAIGNALGSAVRLLHDSKAKSKVVILLSDGDNNAGNIDPITAAELANDENIKIYTIAVGKEGKVPITQTVKDFFGRERRQVSYHDNVLNETTLRKIADIGEGKFFRVSNNSALEQVFKRIDQYEKVEIKETHFKDTTDFYKVYLLWAILLFMIWLFLKSTFVNNVLQD